MAIEHEGGLKVKSEDRSGNSMLCEFCNKETDAERIDKSAKSYICGDCVAYLGNRDQEELLKGYLFALEKGYPGKARAIQSFLEENINDRKTENTERDMIKKRLSRSARPSRNRVRA